MGEVDIQKKEYPEAFSRTALLLGQKRLKRLSECRVAVFGVGGVGGYVVEGLIRSGVGALDLIDNDTVAESNLNRQIIATCDTIGRAKVDVARERCLSINPQAKIRTYQCFYLPETQDQFDFTQYDYVVDAIDTVTGKIALVMQAQQAGVPIISAMGAGNKLDPTAFEVADIYETSICPLARIMRKELKKRGVKHLKVVYSREEALTPLSEENQSPETQSRRRSTPGSVSFVPSVAGLIIAGEVVKDLTLFLPRV
ncbi:MAG: tRNA threonylcarbamoyladenosine dehydratase [Lachnospiraceae bacterium]|nr:tRNA threonylcarbamoyladenosine dehydratase [Lachnospiraceae bacterium]